MTRRTLAWFAVVSMAATFVAIFFVDRPVAELIHGYSMQDPWILSEGIGLLDLVTGKDESKFLLGFVLLALGAALLVPAGSRRTGRGIIAIAAVQLLSTLIAGMAKLWFGRLRPYELLQSGAWDASWFAGGQSFPSGHTAFYFGLFVPLACRFPRCRVPLLLVPSFVALSRIFAEDHFLGDVTASIALAALLTLVFSFRR